MENKKKTMPYKYTAIYITATYFCGVQRRFNLKNS